MIELDIWHEGDEVEVVPSLLPYIKNVLSLPNLSGAGIIGKVERGSLYPIEVKGINGSKKIRFKIFEILPHN